MRRCSELKGEPLARETASKTDEAILSWPHDTSSASSPWSDSVATALSISLAKPPI